MSNKKVTTFEDLEIWELSRKLTIELSTIFYSASFKNYSFQDQIMRAAISIGNNISEGFERDGNREFVRFLFIAKGSCGEVRSMLYTAKDLGYISTAQFDQFNKSSILLSRKIFALIKYLRNIRS